MITTNVGKDGSYENVSKYIHALIRRDEEPAERKAFERLEAEIDRVSAETIRSLI